MKGVLRVLSLKPRDHPRFSTFRVDAFTDAMYAIAATVLVLELRPPDVTAGHLGASLLDLWPHYLAYAIGFIQIVGGWMVLKRITSALKGMGHYSTLFSSCARWDS